MDTPFHKFLALKVLPLTDTDNVLFNLSRTVPQGKMLDMVKLPVCSHLIPYYDELESEPHSRGWCGLFIAAIFVALSLIGYWDTQARAAGRGLSDHLSSTAKNSKCSQRRVFEKNIHRNPSFRSDTCYYGVCIHGWYCKLGPRSLDLAILFSELILRHSYSVVSGSLQETK